MRHKTYLRLLSTLCIAASALGAVANENQKGATAKSTKSVTPAPRISSKVDVAPAGKLTAEESREVAFAAGRILKHVDQARFAIADKKKEEALQHVSKAIKLTQIIDNVLPHYKLKTEIKSGDYVYQEEEDVTSRYITLYEELDRFELVAPVMKAKKEAKQKQDAEGAVAPVVAQDTLEYTAIRLDYQLTKQMLNLAKEKLGSEDHKDHLQAGAALFAIQTEGVLFEYDAVDLPLAQAADNLKLAEDEMNLGRHDAAKVALRAAADELHRYESTVGANRGKDVKQLQDEINKMTAALDKGKPSSGDTKKHAAAISRMWQRVTNWFKKR